MRAQPATALECEIDGEADEAEDEAGGDGDEEAEGGDDLAGDHIDDEDGVAGNDCQPIELLDDVDQVFY